NRLDAFLRDPGGTTLASVLGRINNIANLKIAPVLSGLLLLPPKDLLRLEYAQQGYAALPTPKDDGAVNLTDLVDDLIHSPLKVALPDTPPLTLAQLESAA